MGASLPQQCLNAGLLDEIQIHLVPLLLGGGVRLFDHLGAKSIELQVIRVVEAFEQSAITHPSQVCTGDARLVEIARPQRTLSGHLEEQFGLAVVGLHDAWSSREDWQTPVIRSAYP
jgi:hypothetical protein